MLTCTDNGDGTYQPPHSLVGMAIAGRRFPTAQAAANNVAWLKTQGEWPYQDQPPPTITEFQRLVGPTYALSGGVVVPQWTVQDFTDQEVVNALRPQRVAEIKAEGLARITALVPALTTLEQVDLMVELWPLLNTEVLVPTDPLYKAREIYVYARNKIAWVNDPARTRAELGAYDAAIDPGWPG